MPSVFERLRTALAPGVDLEREHASGGMGDVFVGRDTVLDRPIAVKVLKQELATAIAAERFLLEARSAARLSHPNVVKVYDSDIADGLLYFTMELIAGETLEGRLKQGPLSAADTTALGRDILAALGAAHRLGIVHRDVKPSNIFLDGGRAKLGDFGIARVLESDTPALTAPGRPIGTPYYMSPEQLRGEQVGRPSDLYSTGLVLYEACTARRWIPGRAPGRGEWSDVPAELRRTLRKALEVEPGERWQDAESFAAALPGHRTRWRPGVVAALVATAMIYLIAYQAVPAALRWWWRHTARYDLILFPFETKGAPDPALERSIYLATVWYFQQLPDLNLVPPGSAAQAWSGSALPQTERLARLTRPMHAHFGAWAGVRRTGARLEVDLRVRNDRGEPILQTVIRGNSAENQLVMADSIGARILGAISGKLPPTYRRGADLVKVSREAQLEFLQGEAAAERDAWLPAEEHYANALEIDSTFILAAWRLGNARRWMPLRPTPPFPSGFRALFQARRNDLPEVDRLLVDAQFAPSGLARLEAYEAARRLAPDDPYVMLLYGDELFHRGPLSGRSLAEAAWMLAGATAGDSTLAPAWEHLAWALIRLGRPEDAGRALTNLDQVAGQPEESEIYLPGFLHVAYTARFDPANLGSAGSRLMESDANLAIAARGALAFDLPDVELEFGSMLAAREDAPRELHASGQVAQGVALMALGRPSAALVALDSAAALFPDPAEARLQAAEWRVIPGALGVPGIIEAEADRGRAVLAVLAARPGGARAAWALAVDALVRRDTGARGDTMAGHWRSIVAQDDSVGGTLGALLAAMAAARGGSPESALLISEPALARDSAGYAPDPFLRAALHLLRGKWQAAAGRPDEADRSWLWYENTDAVGWPSTEAQPAEVDWALGSWARVQRASLASAAGRPGDACALGRRVLELWHDPEQLIARVADSLRTSLASCRP